MKDYELERFKHICEGTLKEMSDEEIMTEALNAFENALSDAGFEVVINFEEVIIDHPDHPTITLEIKNQ